MSSLLMFTEWEGETELPKVNSLDKIEEKKTF